MRSSFQAFYGIKALDSSIGYITYISIIVGLFIGVTTIQNKGNYFIYSICLLCTLFSVFWTFVMLVNAESWLVCSSRCLRLTEVPIEKMSQEE